MKQCFVIHTTWLTHHRGWTLNGFFCPQWKEKNGRKSTDHSGIKLLHHKKCKEDKLKGKKSNDTPRIRYPPVRKEEKEPSARKIFNLIWQSIYQRNEKQLSNVWMVLLNRKRPIYVLQKTKLSRFNTTVQRRWNIKQLKWKYCSMRTFRIIAL